MTRDHGVDSLASRYDPLDSFLNGKERKAVRRHLGEGFTGWLEGHRRRVHATGDEKLINLFESDWHPDGPRAYWDLKRTEQLTEHVEELIRQVREETRIQVTRELTEQGDN
jgi:hypothetical protein